MLVNRLPQIMAEKAISIRQLSRMTGITYTTIRAVYHGERRSVQFPVLEAVCHALGVQPGDIFQLEPAEASLRKPVEPQKRREEKDGDKQVDRRIRQGEWRQW